MDGYHFTGKTLRDGRPIPPIGEWLEHDGPLVPCKSGLHASAHPFDALKYALKYAPGNMLHRVELEGDLVLHGDPPDKCVGRRRKIIATIDATSLLREYARWCASQVLYLWDAPQVVRDYLATGDESLRDAARDAAEAAAWDAGDAAGAARDAARDAAWAAWAAARAARDAAWAARDAARAAAGAAQRAKFAEMVDAVLPPGACSLNLAATTTSRCWNVSGDGSPASPTWPSAWNVSWPPERNDCSCAGECFCECGCGFLFDPDSDEDEAEGQ